MDVTAQVNDLMGKIYALSGSKFLKISINKSPGNPEPPLNVSLVHDNQLENDYSLEMLKVKIERAIETDGYLGIRQMLSDKIPGIAPEGHVVVFNCSVLLSVEFEKGKIFSTPAENLRGQYETAIEGDTPQCLTEGCAYRAGAVEFRELPYPTRGLRMPKRPDPAERRRKSIQKLSELRSKVWKGNPDLIEALKDGDAEVRREAAYTLGNMGSEARDAVPALIGILKDGDVFVRQNVAIALGRIGPDAKEAVPALIEALKDGHHYVRHQAAAALEGIGPCAKEAVPALIEALMDENANVRWKSSLALGRIGPDAKEAVPALANVLMKDEDSGVRVRAAFDLGRIGAKEAVPALIEALKDWDSTVRGCVAYALWKIDPGVREVVPALIQALKDGEVFVREYTASALGSMGPAAREAIPALTEALGIEKNGVVGGVMREALMGIRRPLDKR